MVNITLVWQGPYEFTSKRQRSLFTSTAAEEVGLYLWTVETSAGYLVYYVGETNTSFARRHYEHFCEYTAGAYTIHRAESFAAGRRDAVYKGFVYPKVRWTRAMPFIDGFEEYAADLVRMQDTLRLFSRPELTT